MRFRSIQVALGILTLIDAISVSPSAAQTRVTSPEGLRRTLSAGDFITIAPAGGQPVAGRLMRLGDTDLDIRVVNKHQPREPGQQHVTIALTDIESLERRRDSARNGAAIGAGIGAGFSAALFAYAFGVDRNEMDEWAPLYARAAAVTTGIGALVGWIIDAANSKPYIRFERSSGGRPNVSVQPLYVRGRGIAVAVSF